MTRVTVGPKRGGGWQVSGGGESHDVATQKQGIEAGKLAVTKMGGGELVVKGRNGRVRMQNTYGGPDPRGSKG
jgi:Uncharacterized protein conserved in bacteria (DUF2188)